MAKRGRDAVSLPPLPMKFREALSDYLKVKPSPKTEPTARKARGKMKERKKSV